MKPSTWRRDRFYTLYSLVPFTDKVKGAVAECGVFKGLSSLIMLSQLKKESFDFKNYYAIDSFKGLGGITEKDRLEDSYQGMYAIPIEEIKKNLVQFQGINIIQGKIPEILITLPEQKYRLVHIDLDIIEPTLGAIKYFYPRIAKGGVMILDDYASKAWPNLKKEIDAWLDENKVKNLALPTCQLVIL